MIPLGYMLKRIVPPPEYLDEEGVTEVCAVSDCVNDNFGDYLSLWAHNGYGLFDNREALFEAAARLGADMKNLTLFYYEAHPDEFDETDGTWRPFGPDPDWGDAAVVAPPEHKTLLGYDVVSFEVPLAHSPLSCQDLAKETPVNSHCLVDTLEEALDVARSGKLADCELGPYRFVAVYQVE